MLNGTDKRSRSLRAIAPAKSMKRSAPDAEVNVTTCATSAMGSGLDVGMVQKAARLAVAPPGEKRSAAGGVKAAM